MVMGSERNTIMHSQLGASLVEAILALPVFFFLLFGIIEYGYAYRARATLNLASFEAVREGSLSNARLDSIEKAQYKGMGAEYVKGKVKKHQDLIENTKGVSLGQAKAKIVQEKIKSIGGPVKPVEIISPNQATFDSFKQNVKVRPSGSPKAQRIKRDVIPNDNLYWRDSKPKDVVMDGKGQKINLQDANILKIKTFWCHRLVTPGLDRIVYKMILDPPAALGLIVSEEQGVCNKLSNQEHSSGAAGSVGSVPGYYVALVSQAVMRMQSPVFNEDLPP